MEQALEHDSEDAERIGGLLEQVLLAREALPRVSFYKDYRNSNWK
jgi:hypothetical protein